MRNFVLGLFLLVGLACPSFAILTTTDFKALCTLYADKGTDTAEGIACLSYASGVVDESAFELFSKDGKYFVGGWADGATTNQAILVFMKYITANPEALNKPAAIVFRWASISAGLYIYVPYKAPMVPSTN